MKQVLLSLPLLALTGNANGQTQQSAPVSPNIILIMADDLGWGDVGFNGHPAIQTPHLDRLAQEGTIFDRFYTGCAVSSPTRASCLTGRNPFRTGVFHANVGILRPEEVTLPEMLQQQGYFTGHFGKWHLGTLTYKEKDANRARPGNTALYNPPREHGYTESFVTESKVPTYDPTVRTADANARFWDFISRKEEAVPYGTAYWKHNGEKETENLAGDDSRIIMDRVLPFIQESKAAHRPFFSAIWFHTPHLPCVAGPEYHQMYKDYPLEKRNYYGCISAMDEQIGRLVDFLKKEGLYENTLICFCSDNGPEHHTPGSAGPLRGRKRDLYEGGIRVPAFMVWPGKISARQRTRRIASTYDFLPTVADYLHLPHSPYELDGESLRGFFERKEARQQPHVVLIQRKGTVIEQQYKLYYEKGRYELYNIEKDNQETTDIAQQHPDVVQRLSRVLQQKVKAFHHSFEGEEYGTTSRNRVRQQWPKFTFPQP